MTLGAGGPPRFLTDDERFRLLVDAVTDYAIYVLDPDGVITNWNTGAERIKGYSAAEIVGSHFSRFYTDEDRAAGLPARAIAIAAREGKYECEGWRVRKDGSRFWAMVVIDAVRDHNGDLLGFAKITRDITERRQAQEALRESERQFRLLVNGVTDYALFMLDPSGMVTNWNSGAQRIKGYRADEIVGRHFSTFYSEGDRANGIPARSLDTALKAGRFEAEGWRLRKDGSTFFANVIIDPIRDEKGQLVGFAKITRDITERKEAERVLQETQAQLAQAQKMQALGELTGGVAHDFNNLLMIAGGYAQIIKKLVGDNPKALHAAEAIETATRRGESLTRQLLSFSRRQMVNPVLLDTAKRLSEIRSMLAGSLGTAIRLDTQIGADVWPVEADMSEFELALVNIVFNARDAMPSGGQIIIRAENVALKRHQTSEKLEGAFVALSVIDEGTGIPKEILGKVFEPFFTTKEMGKGTGLGLSQAHGFAHQAGGTLTIDSEIGKGTRVTLYLPRGAGTPQDNPVREPVAAPQRGDGRTVLLVEDNPEVAHVSGALLEQLGYQVRMASDAASALEAIDGATFSFVLSDIVMAGSINGLGLARLIRARYPTLPVFLATGYGSAAEEAAREFIVLRKPYEIADITRAVSLLANGSTPFKSEGPAGARLLPAEG
jgi:PAS domain S-box-containing protein